LAPRFLLLQPLVLDLQSQSNSRGGLAAIVSFIRSRDQASTFIHKQVVRAPRCLRPVLLYTTMCGHISLKISHLHADDAGVLISRRYKQGIIPSGSRSAIALTRICACARRRHKKPWQQVGARRLHCRSAWVRSVRHAAEWCRRWYLQYQQSVHRRRKCAYRSRR